MSRQDTNMLDNTVLRVIISTGHCGDKCACWRQLTQVNTPEINLNHVDEWKAR